MGPLEVEIRAKAFVGADGTPLPVLTRVSFALEPGSATALVGPSGSGKTTILGILLGLDRDFDGRVVGRPWRVGAVFQEPRLLPWRTVADNIRLVAPALDDGRVAALLALVGLAGGGERFPRELSLGMARRAALARALAPEPELLVLDEPLVSLDGPAADGLLEVIAGVSRGRGVTTLLVTHDLDEAARLADRVLVLGGRPATLIERLERRPAEPDADFATRLTESVRASHGPSGPAASRAPSFLGEV